MDRDRIIHSESFRALQYKTQVHSLFESGAITDYRTRLNHVIEVAQIARSVARLIGASESLCEAMALAHDLGHPPFGHAGERALQRALAAHGHHDWNANIHSLFVADVAEQAFVESRGLDLTWATREGIARHSTPFDEPVSFGDFASLPQAGLETQIVDAADVLAYVAHDLDDAVLHGFVSLEEVAAATSVLRDLVDWANSTWDNKSRRAWPVDDRERLVRRAFIARLINDYIVDTAAQTSRNLVIRGIADPVSVRENENRSVTLSEPYDHSIAALLSLLTRQYYRSRQVQVADARGEELLSSVFEALVRNPKALPKRIRSLRDVDHAVQVAVYLASLNDWSVIDLARKLRVPEPFSALSQRRDSSEE